MIKRALREDLRDGDITTESIVPPDALGKATLVAKEELVVCGLGVACATFSQMDPRVKFVSHAFDGDEVPSGGKIMDIEGKLSKLLAAERTALNFLQRMSGVATLTRKFVRETEGTPTQILDTRKTLPMYRHLDKYAVRKGGGVNHRFGLYDAIMIKDNHISALHGSIELAIQKAKTSHPNKKVIVEIAKLSQIEPALNAGAEHLLLDNMTNSEVSAAIQRVKNRAKIEVSGGVNLDRIRELAKLNVDYISIGALTHSPKAADISLLIEDV